MTGRKTPRPQPHHLLTDTAERILTTRYPGQIPAIVIERALMRMAAADQRRQRTAGQQERHTP